VEAFTVADLVSEERCVDTMWTFARMASQWDSKLLVSIISGVCGGSAKSDGFKPEAGVRQSITLALGDGWLVRRAPQYVQTHPQLMYNSCLLCITQRTHEPQKNSTLLL
jgi:hypothetical protein